MTTARALASTTARRNLGVVAILTTVVFGVVGLTAGWPWGLLTVAGALVAATMGSLAVLPWRRLAGWTHTLPAFSCVGVLVLLRQTDALTSSYVLLALLPVLWLARYTDPRYAGAALGSAALGFGVPELMRASQLSSALAAAWEVLVFVAVATILVVAVRRLLAEGDARATRAFDAAVQAVAPSGHPREPSTHQALCQLAAHRTGADQVVLVEDVRGRLVIAGHSAELAQLDDRALLDSRSSAAARAHRTGRAVWSTMPDSPDDPLLHGTGVRSVHWEPVWGAGAVRAVVALGFHDQRRQLDLATRTAARAAAADIGWVLAAADRVAELEAAATTDHLTGLPNRRWLSAHAGDELMAIRRENRPACLLMIDLDCFKAYNDTHGHAAGDDVLQRFAAAADRVLRGGEMLARWGGEEFVAFLPGCTADAGSVVADRVRRVMPGEQTCSVGVAGWDGAESLSSVLGRADAAMYLAKQRGRNRVVVADPVAADEAHLGLEARPAV